MENHLFLIGKSTISRAIFNRYVTLQRDGTMTCVFLKLEHQMEKHVVAIAVAVVVDNVVEDMIMMVMMAMSST